ncbi:MAG: SPFH domain-containing protein [Spirochaetes bacterium]|nr:SPFH domain-containing protein [Spirochaetota bacterium]
MGKVQKIVVAAFIIAALIYVFVRVVVIVGDGVVAIVTDKEGQVLGQLHKGVNIVPQGITTHIKAHYIPLNNTCHVDITIPVPPLEVIKSEHYSIKIPVAVTYRLNPGQLSLDLYKLYSDAQYLPQQIQLRLLSSIKDNIAFHLYPYYQYNVLQANINREIGQAIAHVKESFIKEGILIQDATVGVIYMPDYAVYAEGKKFLLELLTQEKLNAIQRNELQHQLKQEQMRNEQYLAYLEKMSQIISKNKDILQYIYIDKLADNVRVIVTSDKNVPWDIASESGSESLKKDFDNFKK